MSERLSNDYAKQIEGLKQVIEVLRSENNRLQRRLDAVLLEPGPAVLGPEERGARLMGNRGIYIASKTKHAHRWVELRERGVPIISTWIDEAGVGESECLVDLWKRCVSEAAGARACVLYREPDEVLKGAWVETGAALACGVPVFAVGIEGFTVANHPGVTVCRDLDDAAALIRVCALGIGNY